MYPKWHILLGAVLCLFLYFLTSINIIPVIVIFLSSFLIDVDHFLFYLKRKKDWNVKKAYLWHKGVREKDKYHKPMLHIFHTLEFLLFMGILAIFLPFFIYVFIGIIFHSILDFIELSLEKRVYVREYSLIRYFLTKDKSKYY